MKGDFDNSHAESGFGSKTASLFVLLVKALCHASAERYSGLAGSGTLFAFRYTRPDDDAKKIRDGPEDGVRRFPPDDSGDFRKVAVMLVLTRKQGETIQVGDGITIKVIRTGKGTVKIGIEAPETVRVLRGELCDKDAEPKTDAVQFAAKAGRPVGVEFAGYFPLPQTA